MQNCTIEFLQITNNSSKMTNFGDVIQMYKKIDMSINLDLTTFVQYLT